MNIENFGLIDGLIVVVIGFSMVFVILCIISFILSIFSVVSKILEKRKQNKVSSVGPENIVPALAEETPAEDNTTDDLELVAVITAAIASAMSTTSDKIIIRSILRNTSWNETAIRENQKGYYRNAD